MSGSALPTRPALEAVNASPPKQASTARDKAGDSTFDAVSRQEKKRLEQREAVERSVAQRDAAQRDAELRAKKSERTEQTASPDSERPERTDAWATAEKPGQGAAPENAESSRAADSQNSTNPDEPVIDAPAQNGSDIAIENPVLPPEGLTDPAAVFTFAGLQALVEKGSGQALAPAGAAASAATGQPGVASSGQPGVLGMVADLVGLKGQSKGTSPASVESGARLVDGLMGQVTAEAAKIAEVSTAGRFQGALDVASQQLAAAGQKIPEAMVPLKGYATSVELPVGHAEWGDKLMGKLAWLTTQKMSVAEIHLTPPDMGPLDVRVQVQNDQASVTIHATNSAVRDQLELHSHRLRDMLNGQGLDLESFDVADSPGRDAGGEAEQEAGEHAGGNGEPMAGEMEMAETGGTLDLTWRGEVDLYA
ncbi:flagellar hook-length control protein FliK [Marinobacter sp.]|uniref:flagellar hook-length control protein FliK n=1 Tax=Marinobacter sp. TaxID=50741 RepID=UPI003850516B